MDNGLLTFVQGSDVSKREIDTTTRLDVGTMKCEDMASYVNAAACTPLGIVMENPTAGQANSGPDAVSQPESTSHEKDLCSKMDSHESSSLNEQEAKVSCHEGKIQSNCVLGDSPSCNEQVNEKSDADESMTESSPSSSASDIADDGAIENGHSSDKYFSASDTDIIDMAVDYVVYQDNHFTGCLISFSCSGIKISGMPAHGDKGTFNFERAIDDIIRIESHHLQRFGTVTVKLHVLSKDAALNAYGVEQLEFAVVEPNWSGKVDEITSLNVKYLALSDIVHDFDVTMAGGADLLRQRPYFPVFDEAFEDVVYPKGDTDAVSISKRDFDLLQPETFINDTIIDFYIKYLKNQIPPEEKHRFHFFNSFFFRKLADLDKDPSSASDGRAAFLRVHKWTRKVDIFGKDYVFIPVNFNLHWSLLVLCHPGEVAAFRDEDLGKSLRVPCILHMDSIKGTHAGLKNLVQSYLWEEWKARYKETSEDLSSKFLNLWFVPLELPQQENSFDCGLFLLHYLELFLAEAPLNFSPFKINGLSKFLNVDWFPPAEASLKRTLIQRLISGLLETHSHELSSGDCSDEPESGFLATNAKETRVQFVSEGCTQTVPCDENLPSSGANQKIEITLLEASSMRNSDFVNDTGLVLREFFEPGVAAGSLIAPCSSFDQSSYYRLNGAVSQQIEDDSETGDQFVYFPSGDSVFQPMSGMTPQVETVPLSSRDFGANSSWNPGISLEGEGDGSSPSPETSVCASDDSDVGIIEDCTIVKDVDPNLNEQKSSSIKNLECRAERLASGSCEKLETSAIEGIEDSDKMRDMTENGDLALCDEIPAALHVYTNKVENGSHQQGVEAETNKHNDMEAVVDDAVEEPPIDDIAFGNSDEKQVINEDAITMRMIESDEEQAVKRRKVAEETSGSLLKDVEFKMMNRLLNSKQHQPQRMAVSGLFVILLPIFFPDLFLRPLGPTSLFSEWNAPTPRHLPLLKAASNRHIEIGGKSELWSPLQYQGWKPCSSTESKITKPYSLPPKYQGYVQVFLDGGLNQQRMGICDAVAVAKILNATLVIPHLEVNPVWQDSSSFMDIFDVDHFIDVLRHEISIVKESPGEYAWSTREYYATGIRATRIKTAPLHASADWYLENVLPVLQSYGIAAIAPFSHRLAFDKLPTYIQRLRCKVNFEALVFVPHIKLLGDTLVNRLRYTLGTLGTESLKERGVDSMQQGSGKYVVLHLRFDKDMAAHSACDFGGGKAERLALAKYRQVLWQGRVLNSQFTDEELRGQGRCPLTPEEIGLLLAALGFSNSTRLYLASHKVYGGEARMSTLKQLFPLMEDKKSLASAEELAKVAGKASLLAAVDYYVSLQSDIFISASPGNMHNALVGHRAYLNLKTIRPNMVLLGPLFLNKSMEWSEFQHAVAKGHKNRQGQIRLRKENQSIYTYPIPDCMCQS